jgi:hypothetical protein
MNVTVSPPEIGQTIPTSPVAQPAITRIANMPMPESVFMRQADEIARPKTKGEQNCSHHTASP